jgi:mannose-6-phosphate isomerase-like protein (cupin superfamily)/glycosyltransferase involved in cell wall biosynthesis
LAAGLKSLGHQVTWYGAGASSLVRPPGATLYTTAQAARVPRLAETWECLHLARCFERARDFDIVHNHAGALALNFAQFVTTPVVTTLYGTPSPDLLPAFRAHQKHSTYLSVGDGARSPELNYAATVRPGIDLQAYAYSPDGGDGLVVLDPLRGDPGLSLALSVAETSGRPLILAGAIEDRAYLEREVLDRLGRHRVRLEDGNSCAARAALLGQAHALLALDGDAPAVTLGVLEAMACGTPVMAGRCGALPELIDDGNTGLVVDSEAEASARLEELQRICRDRCRHWVEQHFGADRTVASTVQVYEDLLAAERPRARMASPPWGRWEVLVDEPVYKVKRIRVEPGKRLSYQRHARRSEHWVMVEGRGLVTLDGREITVEAGQTVDVPRGAAHRIANPDDVPLVFIEIQSGEYFGEDDIERLDDDYGRTDPS